MFINFARKLFEILINDEFSYIRQVDNRLVYETEALSLYKDKGSILYIVTIINAERLEKEKYEELIKRYTGILDGKSKPRMILMNVIVNDSDNNLVFEEDYTPEKGSYVFTYKVNLENGELLSPPEQPDLLGIREKIEEAVEERGEEYVNGTHLESLESELSEKTALSVKSDNIYLVLFIITICASVWVLMEASGGSEDTWTLVSFGAISQNLVLGLGEYYRLFTAMFLHIGIVHLANNCLSLYIFGSRVEKYFGKLKMIMIYVVSGIIGNIVSVLLLPGMSAGASGAIFGLLGSLLAVTYRTGRSVGELSPYVILLLCISSIGMGFINPAVNNFAHVAGFITGVLMGRIFYKK